MSPLDPSLPKHTPTHLEWWISLSSMIHPFAQFGPTRPCWWAVGGAHWVAACAISKPRTVIQSMWCSDGQKTVGRTLTSTRDESGARPPKFAQIVVAPAPTSANQTSSVTSGSSTGTVVPVQESRTLVRRTGAKTWSRQGASYSWTPSMKTSPRWRFSSPNT